MYTKYEADLWHSLRTHEGNSQIRDLAHIGITRGPGSSADAEPVGLGGTREPQPPLRLRCWVDLGVSHQIQTFASAKGRKDVSPTPKTLDLVSESWSDESVNLPHFCSLCQTSEWAGHRPFPELAPRGA